MHYITINITPSLIRCKLKITKWHAIHSMFSFKLELHFCELRLLDYSIFSQICDITSKACWGQFCVICTSQHTYLFHFSLLPFYNQLSMNLNQLTIALHHWYSIVLGVCEWADLILNFSKTSQDTATVSIKRSVSATNKASFQKYVLHHHQ